ncbi:MAG TPA: DUF3309 family protein [Rhizomicrobium sp.]|nr:DUF3309 family protein [Rhizomicrobium sp.]
MLGTILVIVLILLLVGAIPSWPYSSGWGYALRVFWASSWSWC